MAFIQDRASITLCGHAACLPPPVGKLGLKGFSQKLAAIYGVPAQCGQGFSYGASSSDHLKSHLSL